MLLTQTEVETVTSFDAESMLIATQIRLNNVRTDANLLLFNGNAKFLVAKRLKTKSVVFKMPMAESSQRMYPKRPERVSAFEDTHMSDSQPAPLLI